MHHPRMLRYDRALILAAVIALFPSVLFPSRALAQAPDTVTDLGNIATNGVSPNAINGSGQVAGSQLSGSVNNAVIWTAGKVSVLTPLAVSQGATALGINDSGEACGGAVDANGNQSAVYWPTTGGIVQENFGVAFAIDAIGDIAGVAGSDAVEWPVSGPPYYPFNGIETISNVHAINNLGHMTGWVYYPHSNPPSHLGFLSSVNGTPVTFSIPNMTACFPLGINNSDQIVGYTGNASGTYAFIWQNKQPSLLPSLLTGGTGAFAYAINDQGIIVGEASDSNGHAHAVVWMPDANGKYTTVSDLNGLVNQHPNNLGKWDFTTGSVATGINTLGQIVGVATFVPKKSKTKEVHGFLLSPNLLGFDASMALDLSQVETTQPAYWRQGLPDSYSFFIADPWGGRTQLTAANTLLNDALATPLRTAAFCLLNFDDAANGPAPADQNGRWQVEQALNNIGNAAGHLGFIAIDVEPFYPGAMSTTSRVQRIQEAVNAVAAAGLQPIIYTMGTNWNNLTGRSTAFGANRQNLPLWTAQYDMNPDLANDFGKPWNPFGGWNYRVGKQYAQNFPQLGGFIDPDIFEGGLFNDPELTIPILTLSQAVVAPGGTVNATLMLSDPVPPGGATVNLASIGQTIVTVPATVTVASGASSTSFQVQTSAAATTPQDCVIAATLGGSTTTATLTVSPIWVNSLKLSASSVKGGNPVTATITLSAPAPAGGLPVALNYWTYNKNNVLIAAPFKAPPASVTVPATSTSVQFTLTTKKVATSVRVVASAGNQTQCSNLTVN